MGLEIFRFKNRNVSEYIIPDYPIKYIYIYKRMRINIYIYIYLNINSMVMEIE